MAADAVLQELYTSSDEDADGAGILSLADDPEFAGPAFCSFQYMQHMHLPKSVHAECFQAAACSGHTQRQHSLSTTNHVSVQMCSPWMYLSRIGPW